MPLDCVQVHGARPTLGTSAGKWPTGLCVKKNPRQNTEGQMLALSRSSKN